MGCSGGIWKGKGKGGEGGRGKGEGALTVKDLAIGWCNRIDEERTNRFDVFALVKLIT